jgi:hypothetical protein
MLRSVTCALAVALSLTGCSTSSVRSQEGQACSTSSSDDPQLVCSPAQDLVCIATYTRLVTKPSEAAKYDGGLRQVYVCRLACNTSADCFQAGDICCPGPIYGKDYGKMRGCVPAGSCEALGEDEPDGGTVTPGDGGAKLDGASAGPEGGAKLDGGSPDTAIAPADVAAPAADADAPDAGTLG